jgi:hypothetical protein
LPQLNKTINKELNKRKLNFFYEKSVAYQDTQQLVDLGFMISTPAWLDYIKGKA